MVAGSFPDTALDTVNSAFFLRFISPALGKNSVRIINILAHTLYVVIMIKKLMVCYVFKNQELY